MPNLCIALPGRIFASRPRSRQARLQKEQKFGRFLGPLRRVMGAPEGRERTQSNQCAASKRNSYRIRRMNLKAGHNKSPKPQAVVMKSGDHKSQEPQAGVVKPGHISCYEGRAPKVAETAGQLCFVLFALQLLVCLRWHDYRMQGRLSHPQNLAVIADLLAIRRERSPLH